MANHGQSIMDALSIVTNTVGQGIDALYAARDKHLGKPEGPFWDTVNKANQWLNTSPISPIKHLNDLDKDAENAGENLGKKLNLAPGLGALLMGAVVPGPGEANTLKKLKPTKAARDLMVKKNILPKRADMRPADFRGVSGDVQAGVTGQAIRMEPRKDYKVANTGVAEPNSKTPRPFTPHHRMGIQDNRAFFAGKTGKEATKRREELAAAGLFPGNQGSNYEPLFDGVKSAKSAKRTGIRSTDHDDVHKLSDARRAELGIKFNRKNRDLDTWNGILIKDLPEPIQRNLQVQLGWEDELIIDKVQSARGKAFRKKFGDLPYEERKKIILNNPEAFANLSTKEYL